MSASASGAPDMHGPNAAPRTAKLLLVEILKVSHSAQYLDRK